MIKLVGVVLTLALASSMASASAIAGSKSGAGADVAATRAYLRAQHEYSTVLDRDGAADAAAIHGLVEHVNGQCPNVLAGASRTKALEALKEEAFYLVIQALGEPQRSATIAFAKKVAQLRWSNRKLTYYVRGSAAEEKASAEIVAPDICADAKAVVAGGFQTIPTATARFIHQVNAAEGKVSYKDKSGETADLHEIILRMLGPYERPDERSLIPRQPSAHEQEKDEALGLKLIFTTFAEIGRGLGAPETSTSPEAPTGTVKAPLPA
jgi:hypothetical protein